MAGFLDDQNLPFALSISVHLSLSRRMSLLGGDLAIVLDYDAGSPFMMLGALVPEDVVGPALDGLPLNMRRER